MNPLIFNTPNNGGIVSCIKPDSTCYRRLASLGVAILAALAPSMALATDYYWDADGDTTAATGGSGNWDNALLLWRVGSAAGALAPFPGYGNANADAFLQGTAGTLTLATGIFVNDLNVAPASGTAYTVAGTPVLTLDGAVQSGIDVASGSSLTITSGLAGASGFTKTSAGTLVLDGVQGANSLLGPITVGAGTLQAGSATNNAASQVLRGNAVNLAAGASLTTAGTTVDLRVGQLSGGGSLTPGTGGAVNVLALGDSAFSGAVTTTGGLNLRGGTGATQTLNGNVTALTGTVAVNSGSTLSLSGTGDSTSGVIGSLALATRGGTITLDNTAGNTSAAAGRVADTAAVTFLGGALSLVGNTAGTSETVGAQTLNSGAATICVTSNSTTAPTTLTLTKTNSLRDSTSMTVNFAGAGGTLGAGGNNPAIKYSGTPYTGTSTGLFSNTTGSDTTIGFAIATTGGDTNWAGYSATNGVIALTNTSRDQTTVSGAATTERTLYAPTANGTLAAALNVGVLKITPTADNLSLNVGVNSLGTPGIMLTGTRDFSITGTTGNIFGTAAGTKYIYTIDPSAALNVAVTLAGSQSPFTKSGAGFLNLNGTSNQVGFTSVQNINVVQGVLRGTTTSFGGAPPRRPVRSPLPTCTAALLKSAAAGRLSAL